MAGLLQRIKRLLLDMIGFGMMEEEASPASQVIDTLERRFAEMRTAVAYVLANQYRIERLLKGEKAAAGDLSDAALQARISQLEARLESAKLESEMALEQLAECKAQLQSMQQTVRDARLRQKLAEMRARAEIFSLTGSAEKDLAAIGRIKEQADIAEAEAKAIAELREALGESGPGPLQ